MKSVKYQARNHVEGRVLRNLWSQVSGEVCFLVRYHICRQVGSQVGSRVLDQVNNEIS